MRFASRIHPILVIIGSSGTGKSTIIRELVNMQIVKVTPTWTTRPPRHGELLESVEHVFVTGTKFAKLEQQGRFLETAKMFGLQYKYGLPKVELSDASAVVPLVMLRAPLVNLLGKHYSNFKTYHIEDSFSRVKKRLLERQKVEGELGTRLSDYKKEAVLGRKIADRVFNNRSTTTETALKIEAAIKEDFGQITVL